MPKPERLLVTIISEIHPDFAGVPARVGGWATCAIVTATPALSGDDIEKEFGIRMASPNHVLRTGQLSVDWTELKKIIVHGGKKIIR